MVKKGGGGNLTILCAELAFWANLCHSNKKIQHKVNEASKNFSIQKCLKEYKSMLQLSQI